MKAHLAKVLGLLVIFGTASFATPILYTFNWISEGQTPLPTSGSFDYDSSAAVGSQFSNFTVVWDSFTFNFTAAANSATVNSTCGAVTSPEVFAFLTGTAECTPTPNTFSWIGNAGGPSPTFDIYDTSGLGTTDIELGATSATVVTGSPAPVSGLYSVGTVIIQQSPVPEPSTLLLALAGGGLFLGRRMVQAWRKSTVPVDRA
jgi:PEP-CTERM motif